MVFKHDFIRCIDYTRIAALNEVSDDVRHYRSYIEYVIQTYHSIQHYLTNGIMALYKSRIIIIIIFLLLSVYFIKNTDNQRHGKKYYYYYYY